MSKAGFVVLAVPTPEPSARVGALLHRHRAQRGIRLDDLAGRSFGSFSQSDLLAIEKGERRLPPDRLDLLVELYRVDRDLVRAAGSDLVLDLSTEQMHAGDWWVPFSATSIDDMLDSYLDLVRAIRGLQTAEPFTLRQADLDALGAALEFSPDRLHDRLVDRLQPDLAGKPRAERLRVVGGLAAISAIAVAGSVLLVQAPWKSTPVELPDQVNGIVATQALTAPAASVPGLTDGSSAAATRPSAEPDASVSNNRLTTRHHLIEQAIPWEFRQALPGWEIRYAAVHSEWWGVTNSVERTVTLFDRPGTSIDEAAAVLVHELGHALDLDRLNDAQRLEWLGLRGISPQWWVEDGLSDFAVGAGDFAEAVAALVLGAPSRSDYGDFTAEQLAFVEAILAAAP